MYLCENATHIVIAYLLAEQEIEQDDRIIQNCENDLKYYLRNILWYNISINESKNSFHSILDDDKINVSEITREVRFCRIDTFDSMSNVETIVSKLFNLNTIDALLTTIERFTQMCQFCNSPNILLIKLDHYWRSMFNIVNTDFYL